MTIGLLKLIVISVSIISAGFVAFTKEIAEKNQKLKWLNNLYFRVPLSIAIVVVPILTNSKIDSINTDISLKDQKIKDSIIKRDRFILDSIHTVEVKEFALKSEMQIAEVMAKYGLKYDSAKKQIEKLVRDSARSLPDPELYLINDNGIMLDSISNNFLYLKFSLVDLRAPSKNIKLKSYFLGELNNRYILYDGSDNDDRFIPFGESMGTDLITTFCRSLPSNKVSKIYCLLKGEFTNYTENKKYTINQLYMYSIWNKKFGSVATPYYEKIIDVFRAKGIK